MLFSKQDIAIARKQHVVVARRQEIVLAQSIYNVLVYRQGIVLGIAPAKNRDIVLAPYNTIRYHL